MKQKHADYQVIPYPKMRRLMSVAYRSAQHKPMIYGLLEVDVTRARTLLSEHKAQTGESLSFTAFIIACLAKAVDENKAVQAIRLGKKHLIVFEDVDVATPIERDVSGKKPSIQYTIRAANRKTFREIHNEIRAAQVEDAEICHEGVQSHPRAAVPAGFSLQAFLLDRLPDCESISTDAEAILGDGGRHGGGHV